MTIDSPQGAQSVTATFSQKGIGDVHLTFENEAHLEVEESKGELEIVYPKRSVRVDPPVAVVDTNVDRKGSRHAAEAYLGFLWSPEGRAIVAKHHYRPWHADGAATPEGFPAKRNDPSITRIMSLAVSRPSATRCAKFQAFVTAMRWRLPSPAPTIALAARASAVWT